METGKSNDKASLTGLLCDSSLLTGIETVFVTIELKALVINLVLSAFAAYPWKNVPASRVVAPWDSLAALDKEIPADGELGLFFIFSFMADI